ncbi:MAG: hypothetical protein LBR11_05175 [Deltaproteobacteria bacterium]|jgi:flagellar biosynthesis protein FlhF|nr:hypothetical protein [Deltaproteobacteria bacterium]
MRIKRFSAKKLPQVIEMIKEEFGLGAVILSQRENPETGLVEVTAGVREEDLPLGAGGVEPGSEPVPAAKPVSPGTPPVSGLRAYQRAVSAGREKPEKTERSEKSGQKAVGTLGLEVKEELLGAINSGVSQIRELILDLAHRQSLAEKWRDQGEVVRLYRRLLATSLEPELARDLVEKAAASLAAWGGDLLGQLRQTVRPLIRCREGAWPRFLALVGPSGSGKTTVLVKLAALAQKRGLKVSVITLDTLKLGATGQLAQYARIMGLGLKACQSQAELDEAREIFDEADLILVDTSTRDFLAGEQLRLLAACEAQTLLVLPANLKTADLSAAYQRAMGPELWGVALSKLDETQTLGGLLTLIIEVNPILGFFSTGPRIPEDFGPARADRFLDLWLGPQTEEGVVK